MKRKIKLLAPGGDIDSIKAAILAGADAIYCGLNQFNARNRATNIDFKDLNGIIHLGHKNNCKVFLTLNILIVGSEIPSLFTLLNKLVHTDIDGVIVQDLGLFYLLTRYFKTIKIHASTQLNTHNKGQIEFLNKLCATQMNLSRELNINEIKALSLKGHKNDMLTEVFVHGSYCISFSGICYMSSVLGGNSGNRGRCSQPCRDRYLSTLEKNNFPLNLKDNSAYFDLKELYDAGVDYIKIEGRMKRLDYVYTVVNCWKKQIQRFYDQTPLNKDNSDLYKVFNRDFSNGYLIGDINKEMFIDNPRDNSIKHLSVINSYSTQKKLEQDKLALYEEKKEITADVKNKIKSLNIDKVPLTVSISGKLNTPLTVLIRTPDSSFTIFSKTPLALKKKNTITKCLTYNFLLERLKPINDTQYCLQHLELENIEKDFFIPFKEITFIKNRILSILKDSKEILEPVEVPFLNKHKIKKPPTLSVLISSKNDANLCNNTSTDIFFQLPDCLQNELSKFIDFFLKNKKLIPWFPSVLIGENYMAALKFLEQVNPKLLVTNNTGIAYKAYEKKIPWIAGPYLNIVNSFSLLCIKENFNSCGSFISNEISKYQIKSIISPENFKLYYRIYHPILMMTSRQCLHHQVIGCEKNAIDADCVQNCNKSSSITHLKNEPFLIKKTKGNYHRIYNCNNFLNTDIVTDLPDIFSSYFIDLRDIKTKTKMNLNKLKIIRLFENLIHGALDSKKELKNVIHPTTHVQYTKGI
ncbi:MAG: U32 family peptidase [Desulfobacula sp.]|jgi:U32 family peptidase|nr:U32 family peptidase [Desulfobacula sp.]MBT6339155.1 U32 family peptidase [Desulfobacula sp.]